MSNTQIQKIQIQNRQIHKYTNTQIHKYKYTNTVYDEVPERPNLWYIFEKRIVQGYQKIIFPRVKHANTKYKYKIDKYSI